MALPGWMAARGVPGAGEEQVQPAGVDLRVGEVEVLDGPGRLLVSGKHLPPARRLEPVGGAWLLGPGSYRIRFQDPVRVPGDAVGLCFPRSSLLRMGAALYCAVWDPGYEGRGQALLVVYNPHGVEVEVGARIAQIVFIRLVEKPGALYRGSYHGEGLAQPPEDKPGGDGVDGGGGEA